VKATGIEAVLPCDDFKTMLEAFGRANRVIYTPFRPEVPGSASSSDPATVARNTKNDPWDGRVSREEQFRSRLNVYAPNSGIKDLYGTLDTLRGAKDAREIAVIREATRIAGLLIMEAMRDARPGMYEYELQADCEFAFKKFGSYGAAQL
jgi:Xaa-Pro aminopeptidase